MRHADVCEPHRDRLLAGIAAAQIPDLARLLLADDPGEKRGAVSTEPIFGPTWPKIAFSEQIVRSQIAANLAREIARRWIATNVGSYAALGVLAEKYDVARSPDAGAEVGRGGEVETAAS